MEKTPYIKVTPNGPYMVYGVPDIKEELIVLDGSGLSVDYRDGAVVKITGPAAALCRCGHSKNAPLCDGTHTSINFNGKETAGFEPYMKGADEIKGPNISLYDNDRFCVYARFCDAGGRIWNLVRKGTKEADELAIKEASNCAGGRLVIFDGKEMVEPNLPQTVSVIEDTGLRISGPIWVKGGIRVESADGKSYEIRNRQALCRCGASSDKPFCNGTHASIKFKAVKAER